jgi:hypothetical protein
MKTNDSREDKDSLIVPYARKIYLYHRIFNTYIVYYNQYWRRNIYNNLVYTY